jgi:cytoskeletal protein CcmA (bactofilin family)
MREERGQIRGDVVVYEPFTLWGSVGGNVTVVEGGKFYLRGAIYGNLIVEPGGRVHIYGNVTGNLKLAEKSKVIVSGMIGGNAINNGGRLYIDKQARVMGKVRTHNDGETKQESRSDWLGGAGDTSPQTIRKHLRAREEEMRKRREE